MKTKHKLTDSARSVLRIARSAQNARQVYEALTNDTLHIGGRVWISASMGQTGATGVLKSVEDGYARVKLRQGTVTVLASKVYPL